MPTNTKTSSKRNAAARSSLARGSTSSRARHKIGTKDDAQATAIGALALIADIRAALGDAEGQLMQDELVDRAHAIVAALKDANDQCRTAWHVVRRRGQDTNWEPYEKSLKASLDRQHKTMYPSNCEGYRGYELNTK